MKHLDSWKVGNSIVSFPHFVIDKTQDTLETKLSRQWFILPVTFLKHLSHNIHCTFIPPKKFPKFYPPPPFGPLSTTIFSIPLLKIWAHFPFFLPLKNFVILKTTNLFRNSLKSRNHLWLNHILLILKLPSSRIWFHWKRKRKQPSLLAIETSLILWLSTMKERNMNWIRSLSVWVPTFQFT